MFFCGLFPVQAQTAGFFLDPDSEEPRFIQRLAWSGGMYSLHCEVIIEKEKDGIYAGHHSAFTTGNYLDISLQPGNYRFRVIPYDILGKPVEGTGWEYFKVFSALMPELYQTGEKKDYVSVEKEFIFAFNGKNLEADTQFCFIGPKGEKFYPVESIVNEDGDKVSLVFEKKQLDDGEYEVYAVNPGGLETRLGGIKLKTPRIKLSEFLYIASASWMPTYPAYGYGFGDDWNISNIYARISMNSCMFFDSYMGLEFSFSRRMDDSAYGLSEFTMGSNILFMNWLPDKKAAANFRIGVGFGLQPSDFYSSIGVSFMLKVVKGLNVEAGVNYVNSFINDGGGIMPWAGISVMF
jgi:hypothetical protein